jgi:hypothetical protein
LGTEDNAGPAKIKSAPVASKRVGIHLFITESSWLRIRRSGPVTISVPYSMYPAVWEM